MQPIGTEKCKISFFHSVAKQTTLFKVNINQVGVVCFVVLGTKCFLSFMSYGYYNVINTQIWNIASHIEYLNILFRKRQDIQQKLFLKVLPKLKEF